MSLLSLFKFQQKTAASQAKERLQILLAHERSDRTTPDFLPQLQHEIIQVIGKYMKIDADKIAVKLDRNGGVSMLEVNIELPSVDRQAGVGTVGYK